MNTSTIFRLCLLLAATAPAAFGASLSLVRDGKPTSIVVTADKPDAAQIEPRKLQRRGNAVGRLSRCSGCAIRPGEGQAGAEQRVLPQQDEGEAFLLCAMSQAGRIAVRGTGRA